MVVSPSAIFCASEVFHPRRADAGWEISVHRHEEAVRLAFPQLAGRGYEVERSTAVGPGAVWQPLNVAGNPPTLSPTNRTATVEDTLDSGANWFYRVRVFEP